MVRSIKEATVKSSHYTSINELRRYASGLAKSLQLRQIAQGTQAPNTLRSRREPLEIKARHFCRQTQPSNAGTKRLDEPEIIRVKI